MVVSVAADAATIFPPHVSDAMGAAIRDQLYDRLADMGDDLNTVGDKGFTPHLADSWEWSRDSMSIAFHLNPRARWHDGQPVRANDVRFSFRIFTDPKVGATASSEIANIDSVSLRDSLTAVVWYKRRLPEAFYDFVYQVYIIPEHIFKDIPTDQLRTSEVGRKGIGSGRFRLMRWNAGQRVELVADTSNYRGRAKLDRVLFSIVPDANAAMAQVLSGQADFIEFVPPDQISAVENSGTVRLAPYPSLQYTFMGMNQVDPRNRSRPHPILGDVRVRRAISMALDRRAMLQNVYGAIGRLSYGPFPRSISFADTALHQLPYDTAHARALLDSAGWALPSAGGVRQKAGRPLRFSLIAPVSSKPRMQYAVLIQEQLRRIGVQVDIDQMQFNAAVQRQLKGDFDAMMLAQFTDPSPSGYKQQWGSAGALPAGQNWVTYRNPVFDALLDSALSTSDVSRVKSYMSRAFQIQIDDAPGVWLYDIPTVGAVHRRIHTQPMRADGWWLHLADWTIPPNERLPRDRVGIAAGGQ